MQYKVINHRIQYNGEWFEIGAPIDLVPSEAATLIQAELVEEVKPAPAPVAGKKAEVTNGN
jgi:hypothetical protein